jgi:hypothetical protein
VVRHLPDRDRVVILDEPQDLQLHLAELPFVFHRVAPDDTGRHLY